MYLHRWEVGAWRALQCGASCSRYTTVLMRTCRGYFPFIVPLWVSFPGDFCLQLLPTQASIDVNSNQHFNSPNETDRCQHGDSDDARATRLVAASSGSRLLPLFPRGFAAGMSHRRGTKDASCCQMTRKRTRPLERIQPLR